MTGGLTDDDSEAKYDAMLNAELESEVRDLLARHDGDLKAHFPAWCGS
jgi:hypothetical protein